MNQQLKINTANRDKLITAVNAEIIGPEVNLSNATGLTETSESNNLSEFYFHSINGIKEEIFTDGKPSRKYAAALLYPQKSEVDRLEEEDYKEEEVLEPSEVDIEIVGNEEDGADYEESGTSEPINSRPYQQSTMGMTFAVPINSEILNAKFSCGIYEDKKDYNVTLQKGKTWWFRKTINSSIDINLDSHNGIKKERLEFYSVNGEKHNSHEVFIYSHVREYKNLDLKIVTLTIENKTDYIVTKGIDTEENAILFQCNLSARLLSEQKFVSYPKPSEMNKNISAEDRKFELLYLNEKNYAFGHDCSVEWDIVNNEVEEIRSTFLPTYEIPTISADIEVNGEKLIIRHSDLASAKDFDEVNSILSPLLLGYKNWHETLVKTQSNKHYLDVQSTLIKDIEKAIGRIEAGINLLKDESVFNCFRLANLAMLMQMTNGKNKREINIINNKKEFSSNYQDLFASLNYSNFDLIAESIKEQINNSEEDSIWNKYSWRAFQIAFLLQSLTSIVEKESSERELVDLIWFPTGGGKTEAYLGVSAFSMLYRRFNDPKDTSVDVLMRYTLRLLTADQFQRSSRLICSLEYIRSRMPSIFGESEYSIGLWVGASTTPNTNKAAGKKYNEIIKSGEGKFIVEMCPWCGAEMKVIREKNSNKYLYLGYDFQESLHMNCPDENCHFNNNIPIYFTDDQLYKQPPTFLIGTIDKFVQLTWIPKARSLFGIGKTGDRIFSPPNLIIQDEFHLISGPLGTLTGMYECLIEDLTTDKRDNKLIKAKIIAATATIKDYKKQVKAIFGKNDNQSSIFPPSGFDINDNFFSKIKLDENTKEPVPGRKYVGVFTTTQGKLQSQVQTLSALIEATSFLPEDSNQRDPFWTILSFYNTIKEIGTAITLTDMDIPNHLNNYYKKHGIRKDKRRYIKRSKVKELTSRLESSKVSDALAELSQPYSEKNNDAFDICLASNIIEVGVDIDRLSLMTIIGQPKTTSQYIQVSGRVGRKTGERPGLVITIYNPTNSNDKSHFEHFKEYHQKLYAQVEVNSVTPFSRFSVERGFPAALIGFIRQNFDQRTVGEHPPYGKDFKNIRPDVDEFVNLILNRAKVVDPSGVPFIVEKTKELYKRFDEYSYSKWRDGSDGFMEPMTKDRDEIPEQVMPVIFSMRSVDATSKLVVKSLSGYNQIKNKNLNDDVKKIVEEDGKLDINNLLGF